MDKPYIKSFPFAGRQLAFSQPDGNSFDVIGWGNHHYTIFETVDGFRVIKDQYTGTYQYARLNETSDKLIPSGIILDKEREATNLSFAKNLRLIHEKQKQDDFINSVDSLVKPRWLQRYEQINADQISSNLSDSAPLLDSDKHHVVGDIVGLCIVVAFPDESIPSFITTSEVDDFFNLRGYTGFGNNGSVCDYFLENSDGKLKYKNVIAPYYTAKQNKSYYSDKTQPYGTRSEELVIEALEYLELNDFNFSSLSVDDENYVHAISILYAGDFDHDTQLGVDGLFPHTGYFSKEYMLSPEKIANDYIVVNISDQLLLGTICHETGHLICNFPDLYDEFKPPSFGVGAFCLMSNSLDIDDKNPSQVCAYLKYRAGWSNNILNVEEDSNLVIQSGTNNFYIHRKNEREYFIIENRQQSGRDKNIPSAGIAIWHVDIDGSNNHEQMTAKYHFECSLVQADGRYDLEKKQGNWEGDATDLFYAGNNDQFNDNTTPDSRWWDGTLSNLEIYDITNSSVKMGFKARIS
ncbi:hypothetical protein C1752_13123 [Acaryochloris thomasi RCC1774]|uniref:Immune inhibitor A n=1 Tax=Acaryochloris thomasi RCC1774 TaxID=1764569 RepID=A0A2W1JNB5_9CYAN|nr:M6 family metalloprotease domain-containing protein [Acaryochloris thomasi]PZD70397.1 hypothetical protein C1752_13123 [Acaryochloris thomasi RCC1774]